MKLTETDLRQHIIQRHSPLVTRRGISSHIDIEQMLASGVIEGPFRPVRPVTLSLIQRLVRNLKGSV